MSRFVQLLLVASVTVGVMSAFAPDLDEAEFGEVEQTDLDLDLVETFNKVEVLEMEKTSLLEEIQRLQERNDILESDDTAKKGESVQRMHTNITLLRRPTDCADLLLAGVTQSGEYDVYPFACQCSSPIRVYCDMTTDGGGWTVIMSRQSQELQVNFNRSWADYKAGFGSRSGEHWLGNDNINQLTSSRSYTFRMDMTRTLGDTVFLIYDLVRVDDESSKYRLYLGTRATESTIGDCFTYNKNRYFSTYDRDYDSTSTRNCATESGGAFWYYNCHIVDPPTGIYDGYMNETCYYNVKYQVSRLQMKIRPTACDSTYKRINLVNAECGGECGEPVPH